MTCDILICLYVYYSTGLGTCLYLKWVCCIVYVPPPPPQPVSVRVLLGEGGGWSTGASVAEAYFSSHKNKKKLKQIGSFEKHPQCLNDTQLSFLNLLGYSYW